MKRTRDSKQFHTLTVILVLLLTLVILNACKDSGKGNSSFDMTTQTKEQLNSSKDAGPSTDVLYYSQKTVQSLRLVELSLAPYIFGDRTQGLPPCIQVVQPQYLWKWTRCAVGANYTVAGETAFSYAPIAPAESGNPTPTPTTAVVLPPALPIPTTIDSKLYFYPNSTGTNATGTNSTTSQPAPKNYVIEVKATNIKQAGNLVSGDLVITQYADQILDENKLQEVTVQGFQMTYSRSTFDTVAFMGAVAVEKFVEAKPLPTGAPSAAFNPTSTETVTSTIQVRFLPSTRMRQSPTDPTPNGSWDFYYTGRKKFVEGSIRIEGSQISESSGPKSAQITCQNFCFSL